MKSKLKNDLITLSSKIGGSTSKNQFNDIWICFPKQGICFEFWKSSPSIQGPSEKCITVSDFRTYRKLTNHAEILEFLPKCLVEVILFNLKEFQEYNIVYDFEF